MTKPKYQIIPLSKPALCKCGAEAMIGDRCWRCFARDKKGIEWVERIEKFEPKYRDKK